MYYSKDGITVAPMLDVNHPDKDGLFPVRIRVCYRRKRKYYNTGKRLSKQEWESMPSTKVKYLCNMRKDIENSYTLVRKDVEELASLGEFSFDALNCKLRYAGSVTINSFFKHKISELQAENRIGTMWAYRTVMNGIERYAGNKIDIGDISVQWVQKYESFLIKEGKGQTTIGIHMRHLRAIINEVRRAGMLKDSSYPFGRGRYEIRSGANRKMALTMEQIGQIARYDDGNLTNTMYRDYWLFMYLCNGINVLDFIKLKFDNIINNEICFIRQKTERTSKDRKIIQSPITPPIQAIINKWGNPPQPGCYIFPILNGNEDAVRLKVKSLAFTKLVNKYMNRIGSNLGIGKISTYTARHSCATILKRAGVSIAYISDTLGHQSIKTTEHYLASFEQDERIKNANILINY